MPWEPAKFPLSPRGESALVTVDDAIVTASQRGVTASAVAPRRWVRGAVYTADGHLVRESQRMWAGDKASPIATDPERLRPMPASPRELGGTWLFAGHFMPPFGHFIVETLTNLWPEVPDLAGLLFQQGYRTPWARGPSRDVEAKGWHQDLFELAGYGSERKHEVLRRPLRVERLLVPSRPVVFKSWALPEAADLWQRVGASAGAPGNDRHVFLSRTEFNRSLRVSTTGRKQVVRSTEDYDLRLDRGMADLGLRVVEPQHLSIRDQVRLVRGADVIVSTSGSALHLSAFARPDVRVVEIGDTRTSASPLPGQQVVDAVYGRTTAFVPLTDAAGATAEVGALLS